MSVGQDQNAMDEDAAATKIQSNYRGCRSRSVTSGGQDQSAVDKDAAATKIQGNYRGYRSRSLMNGGQDQSATDEENAAATKIQSSFRVFNSRRCLDEETAARFVDAEQKQSSMDEDTAALMLQKRWKGWKVRVQVGKEHVAASHVQRLYRGHLSRVVSGEATRPAEGMIDWLYRIITNGEREKLQLKKRTTKLQEKEATRLQATYRGHVCRRDLAEKKALEAA